MIQVVENIEPVFPLIQQLRPNLTFAQFIEIYKQAQKADQYKFYGYFENGNCVGLMGLRILYDYVHLKHLYIDDLVVDEKQRSSGVGTALLKFAEQLAHSENCTGLRLCTGNENDRGIKFYEREKWSQRALVFKKKVSSSQI